jgi:hypothetical protein
MGKTAFSLFLTLPAADPGLGRDFWILGSFKRSMLFFASERGNAGSAEARVGAP